MIRVTLEVNGRVFEQFVDDVSAVPAAFIDTLEREYVPAENARYGDILNTSPGPTKHPFQFATESSMRLYFWAARTGNLPTTDGGVRQWKVEGRRVDEHTYEVWLVNDALDSGIPGVRGPVNPATYVFGPRQVPGHANTGFPNVYLTLAQERSTSAVNALTLFGRTFKGVSFGSANR